MRGPQVLLAHALLERVDDRAAGVVEGVVGEAREHQVEWLDLVAHERVRPVEAAGARALAVPTNLADEADVAAMVATTVEHFGRVDILVNNAAITFVGDLDIPMRRHDLVMEVNLRAPLLAIREVKGHMARQGGGAILNVSSVAALYPHPGLMSYGMSKVALERLTVDAAMQLQRDGIAVNCFRIDVPVASEGFVANTPGV